MQLRSFQAKLVYLTVAVLVDSSQPLESLFRLQVVEAVTGFLRTLPEGTRYALWITGDRPKKILDFTSDVAAAREPLRRVFPQGGNTVFDALVEVSRELKKLEGQRTAIVVVTGLGIGFTNWDRRQVVDEGAKSGAVFLVASFEDARTTVEGGRSGDGEIGIAALAEVRI